ncbi:hypothetical protein [Phyllobacterium sp. SB3]|uniref:hypothetical protein n=1 Tax=Phyllobacterium sp. SB3 TaxID=3156073 RepID=UPI0032AEA3F8
MSFVDRRYLSTTTIVAIPFIFAAGVILAPQIGSTSTNQSKFAVLHRTGKPAKIVDAIEFNSSLVYQRSIERLNTLKYLDDDFDGEGAASPTAEAIDAAISFVKLLPFYAPEPSVGVDRDGNAIVEFHEENETGQVLFGSGGYFEAFYSKAGGKTVSFEGQLGDAQSNSKFIAAFGFPLEA